MALTERANAWLATLDRETPLAAAVVDRLIREAGSTPHPEWLAFHDNYAGYIEQVGPGDIAIWGLARPADASPAPIWFAPDSDSIVPAQYHFPEAVLCADAHPVHGYELGADGAFRGIGGPAATFEMKLERHGLMKEFYDRGKVRRTFVTRKCDEPQNHYLLRDMAEAFVPEASDKAMQFFLEPKRLLQFCPFSKQLLLFELDAVS